MAREESSREDLLREATALNERIELYLNGEQVVAGFRTDGSLSIFFGEDPVYQFNTAGELRRAYCGCKLLKAERGHLVALQRTRTENEVQLVRHELSEAEQAKLFAQMAEHLRNFEALLNTNAFEVVGQVPHDADVTRRLKAWFSAHKQWPVANRPNAGR